MCCLPQSGWRGQVASGQRQSLNAVVLKLGAMALQGDAETS